MNFVEKTENEIIIKFKNKENLFLNSKNLLKEGWPLYEAWVNDVFIGHWEFIPNKLIGVSATEQYKYWAFIYDLLFIFDAGHLPSVIFQKDGEDFKGHGINDFNIKYHLKYIET